jgi:prephenate dehydratase
LRDIASVSLGTIGGPETFAGQSTDTLRALYPQFALPVYYPTAEIMFAALSRGEVDAVVGASATIGAGYTTLDHMIATTKETLFVVAEEPLSFHSLLLGKHEATLADIKLVYLGRASIDLGRRLIADRMQNARTELYADPIATACRVAEGDGTTAILGTRRMAEKTGLSILADDIDADVLNGNWWAISTKALLVTLPERLFIAGRFADDAELGRLLSAISAAGFYLATASAYPSGGRLLEFYYLLRFRGSGPLNLIQSAIKQFPRARIAGALKARGQG